MTFYSSIAHILLLTALSVLKKTATGVLQGYVVFNGRRNEGQFEIKLGAILESVGRHLK